MTQWFIQLNKCKIKVSRSYVLLNAHQGKFERVLWLRPFINTMLSALQGRSASPNVVRPSLKWLNIWSLLLWCKCRPVRTAIMEGPTGLSTSHFFVQGLWPEYFTVCVLHCDVMKTSKFRAKWRLHEEVSEPDLVLQLVHQAMCYIKYWHHSLSKFSIVYLPTCLHHQSAALMSCIANKCPMIQWESQIVLKVSPSPLLA